MLEKKRNILAVSSRETEKLEQNFFMTQNANLASIIKKIDLNMNTSNWLFILDIEDGM